MVHPSSLRIPRVRRYSGYCLLTSCFAYVILTLSDAPSHVLRLHSMMRFTVLTPSILLRMVWPLPLSLATTRGISFDFSSSPYLDVSVREVPLARLWIHRTITGSSPAWFPNSEICGSTLIYSSPQLIAVSHVLLRLLMPRHSPYALSSLNFSWFSLAWVSQIIVSVVFFFLPPRKQFPVFAAAKS